jgi:5-methylcytosine-specific restriction endonuclease McrA
MAVYKSNSTPIEMNSTKKAVLKRDDYRCQICGVSNKRLLIIHHIKELNKHPELKFKRANLVTLCRNCHRLTHMKLISLDVSLPYNSLKRMLNKPVN